MRVERRARRACVVGHVQVVEVDVVGAEALERSGDGAARRPRARGPPACRAIAAEADLGGDDDAVAIAAEGAAEDALGLAVVVCVGGVEHADAPLERAPHDALALRGRRALAEVHRAERERGRLAGRSPGHGAGRHGHALFLPRLGLAHTLGLSTAEFDVAADGRVGCTTDVRDRRAAGEDQRRGARRTCVRSCSTGSTSRADGVAMPRVATTGAGVTRGRRPRARGELRVPSRRRRDRGDALLPRARFAPGHREIARHLGPAGQRRERRGGPHRRSPRASRSSCRRPRARRHGADGTREPGSSPR